MGLVDLHSQCVGQWNDKLDKRGQLVGRVLNEGLDNHNLCVGRWNEGL